MRQMRQVSMAELERRMPNTLMQQLGMKVTGMGPDWIEGTMPVDHRTRQIHGILHGGASAALVESLASIGASLTVDPATHRCVGVELNANHVRGVAEGTVTGRAHPRHLGRTSQVWQVDVHNEAGQLVCTGRLTVAVLEKRGDAQARPTPR